MVLCSEDETPSVQPDVLAYNSAISAYAAAGDWEKAWALFGSECHNASLLETEAPAFPICYFLHASTCCESKPSASAHNDAQQNAHKQRSTSDRSCQQQALLTAPAMQLSSAAMKRFRMRPTTRSYNALLSACERAGQPDRALEVFANMQRTQHDGDYQLQPTAVTYNTLLSACGKAGRCHAEYLLSCRFVRPLFVLDCAGMGCVVC